MSEEQTETNIEETTTVEENAIESMSTPVVEENSKENENKQKPTQTTKKPLSQQNHEKIENFFENISELIKGEMKVGLNELELLEKMNFAVGSKYENMAERTSTVKKSLNNLKEECKFFFALKPKR
jgi:hypothetical protein